MKVPTLPGTRVTLRPLRVSDAPTFCRWLNNPEVTRFLARHKQPPTLREERVYLGQQQRRRDHAQWGIEIDSRTFIGTVGMDRIDRENRQATYGIFIGEPRYWGKGYGTEAGQLAVSYGFRRLGLHRIMLYVFDNNPRGLKSYRKLGFRVEGRLREHRYRAGAYHDLMVMGMLRSEFKRP